ncbi:MAG TPA: MarR family transcriptional regulator [Acidimicrobiales bacterium]
MAGEQDHVRSVPDTAPVDELMSSLQRLGRLLASRQVASRISTAAGVDVTQQGAALLRVLLREGRLSVAALAAAVPMEIAAVSRQLRLLEVAGAASRSASPDDGRVALIDLTPEGRALAERIRAVGVRHLQEALDGWSAADQRRLAGLMQRLVDDLRATPVRPERSSG